MTIQPPEVGTPDWGDDLNQVLEALAQGQAPTRVQATVSGATSFTELGTMNDWTVTAPSTINLPTTVEAGRSFLVHIDKYEWVTWGAGIVTVGQPPATGPVWVSLMRAVGGWEVLIPGGGSGSGFPLYDASHALFSPGSGNGASLTAFNDFFGLSLSAAPDHFEEYPFLYANGSVGVVWWNEPKAKWYWGTWTATRQAAVVNLWLPKNSDTGLIAYPASKIPSGGGMQPFIVTNLLGILAPSDFRDSLATAGSVPTAVNTVADLASIGGDSNVPLGVCIFVASAGKPAWKKATNATATAAWVWADGTAVS